MIYFLYLHCFQLRNITASYYRDVITSYVRQSEVSVRRGSLRNICSGLLILLETLGFKNIHFRYSLSVPFINVGKFCVNDVLVHVSRTSFQHINDMM